MADSDDTDVSRIPDPAEGVTISDDGYYTCKQCSITLGSTGESRTDDDGQRRDVWYCPKCHENYEI